MKMLHVKTTAESGSSWLALTMEDGDVFLLNPLKSILVRDDFRWKNRVDEEKQPPLSMEDLEVLLQKWYRSGILETVRLLEESWNLTE